MARRGKMVTSACLIAAVATAIGFAAANASNDDWVPTLTDDPQLIALGRSLFEDLPPLPGTARDPFGTSCGVASIDYCITTPDLAPEALVAAAGARLTERGARREWRDCPKPDPQLLISLCREAYSYRGVHVGITAGDDAVPREGDPTHLFGQVFAAAQPATAAPVPLGPWSKLNLTPSAWQVPPCAVDGDEGCLQYRGTVAGPESPEEAHKALRAKLEQAGYRIEIVHCTTDANAATRCNLGAHRYRALGGRDEVTVVASLKSASPVAGFTGLIAVTSENAKPAPPFDYFP